MGRKHGNYDIHDPEYIMRGYRSRFSSAVFKYKNLVWKAVADAEQEYHAKHGVYTTKIEDLDCCIPDGNEYYKKNVDIIRCEMGVKIDWDIANYTAKLYCDKFKFFDPINDVTLTLDGEEIMIGVYM